MSEAISFVVSVVGALVLVTNMVVEVLKKVTWEKFPTNLLAVIVAVALTVVAFVTYMKMMELAFVWWYWPPVIVAGLLVSYAAMFGYDKFKEMIWQWKGE